METLYDVLDWVSISGEANYGGTNYRVACDGRIIYIPNNSKYVLVNLEEIDGDKNVNVYIHKKYITGFTKTA